jgi:hypothetical protein
MRWQRAAFASLLTSTSATARGCSRLRPSRDITNSATFASLNLSFGQDMAGRDVCNQLLACAEDGRTDHT